MKTRINWGYWLVPLVVGLAIFAVTGCMSAQEKKDLMAQAIEYAKQQQPRLSIKGQNMTISGVSELVSYDPLPKLDYPTSEWAPVANSGIAGLSTVAGVYVGGQAAIGLATAVGNSAKGGTWNFTPQGNSGVNYYSPTGLANPTTTPAPVVVVAPEGTK